MLIFRIILCPYKMNSPEINFLVHYLGTGLRGIILVHVN